MTDLLNSLTVVDAVGTAGTLIVVLAYLGTQMRVLDAAGFAFPAANPAGSLPITVPLWVNFNLASAVMEPFWIAIGLFGIGRRLRERRAGDPGAPC